VTFSGIAFDPINPDPSLIDIVDIAHSLSTSNRYTGHVRWPYTVGQHSLNVSYCVAPENALEALLHDGTETYLSDVASPIKKHSDLGDVYNRVEEHLYIAVAERFGLDNPLPDDVVNADRDILTLEVRYLMPQHPLFDVWTSAEVDLPLTKADFAEKDWRETEMRFLARFGELTRERELYA
jgi:hypothetical protein